MADRVLIEFYRGFTRADMVAERDKALAARKAFTQMKQDAAGSTLRTGKSEGSEVELVPANFGTFTRWLDEIDNAFAQLDAEIQPYRRSTVGGFR